MSSSTTFADLDQVDEVLQLLRQRGARGIVSTEGVALGIPKLQSRIRDLRAAGHVIGSVPVPGTRLTKYVLGHQDGQDYVEPWAAGVKAVWRPGSGWSVEVMASSTDRAKAEEAASMIRSALRYLSAEDCEAPGLLDD